MTGKLEWDERGEGSAKMRADFSLVNTRSEITDSDQVTHEINTWTLEAVPAEDTEKPFEDVNLSGYFHFYSRPGQTSRTTLELDASGRAFGEQIALTGKFVGVSLWEILPIEDVSEAQDVTRMTEAKRAELLSDFAANLMLILSPAEPAVPPASETETAPEETPQAEPAEPETEEAADSEENEPETTPAAEAEAAVTPAQTEEPTAEPQVTPATETAAPAAEQPEVVEEDIDLDEEAAN